MTTITLPPLPEPDFALDQGDEPCYYAHTLRAYSLEVARVVLEGAAKVCRDAELGLWDVYKKGDGPLKRGRGSEYVQGASDQSALLAGAVVNLEFKHHE